MNIIDNKEIFEEQLEKAGKFHGDICGGIVIGTKLAIYALGKLGMELNQKNKDLIVFLEIDRCMSDAVQAVTGCSMGKRSLKQMNYGKFAASFYKISTGGNLLELLILMQILKKKEMKLLKK
nr:formylmethanofuran dehydrogenase subunit E family protein [Methanobrevibacter arboriphilus]